MATLESLKNTVIVCGLKKQMYITDFLKEINTILN